MVISNFLNLEEENKNIIDIGQDKTDEEVLQEVLEEHLGVQSTQDDDEEEEQPKQLKLTLQEAQQALQVLIEYTKS